MSPWQAKSFRKVENSFFQGAIIVGVGNQEDITGFILERSVEKAALKYALYVSSKKEDQNYENTVGISSVLMCSRYGKVQIDTSIEAIIKGIVMANEQLEADEIDMLIDRLEIIEIYEEKCDIAYLVAHDLAQHSKELNIHVAEGITRKAGSRIQLPSIPGADLYQKYTVTLDGSGDTSKKKKKKKSSSIKGLVFTSDSGLARVEKVVDYANHHLIDSIANDIPDVKWDPRLSKALFELLIPNAFKSNIKRQPNILLELDITTASYPWEMMSPNITDTEPLAVRSSIVRKFATMNYVRELKFVAKNSAFLLGNPKPPIEYDDLPGAKEETDHLFTLLNNQGFSCTYDKDLEQYPSDYIIDLLTNEYKFIHISAHGEYNKKDGTSRIIIGPRKNDVITTVDLCKMPYTPDLAFINCCFLGKYDEKLESQYQDRHKIAASIGMQLLNHGYKMVVVAGWAVDDQAAKDFSDTFYAALLDGAAFGDAVSRARKRCYNDHPGVNTWGAYQCYGNPDYQPIKSKKKGNGSLRYHLPIHVKKDIREFLNKLEYKQWDEKKMLEKMDLISERISNSRFKLNPEILELEARCYAEIRQWDKALELYRLLFTGNSRYSTKSIEQYCNVTVRAEYLKDAKKNDRIKNIEDIIEDLDYMMKLGATPEKYSIKGGAYKRLFVIKPVINYLRKMNTCYREAILASKSNHVGNCHYPLISYLKGVYFLTQKRKLDKEVIAFFGPYTKTGEIVDELKRNLLEANHATSFWDEIASATLHQYLLVSAGLSEDLDDILEDIKSVYKKAWKLGGTELKRSTEIEHLDFLIAGVEYVKRKNKSDARRMSWENEKLKRLNKLQQLLRNDLNK